MVAPMRRDAIVFVFFGLWGEGGWRDGWRDV